MGFASGVTNQLQNVGNVVNKGVELSVNAALVNRKRFQWNVSANLAYNRNEITDMGATDDVIQGSDKQQILRKGEPLGAFYGLRFNGIVQNGEDISLEELNDANHLALKEGRISLQEFQEAARVLVKERMKR